MSDHLTARDVLDDLDHDARTSSAFFPDFDHGYSYHVDARLSAYGDGRRWVLVIEHLGVNPRSGSFGGVATDLYYHGNAIQLPPQPGWSPYAVQTIPTLSDGPSAPLFLPFQFEEISPRATDLAIRGQIVPIRTDPNFYRARKIEIEPVTNEQIDQLIEGARQVFDPETAEVRVGEYEEMRKEVGRFKLNTWHVLRGLVPEHRELLLATDVERRLGVPAGLPLLVQLDEWDHPRWMDGELPSHCESFKFVANVIASGKPQTLELSEPSNIHWSNWPLSGSL